MSESSTQSEEISILMNQHPGYIQKLCFFLFVLTGSKVTPNCILEAQKALFANETNYFESIIQGLNTKQAALLIAIAREPGGKVFSADFMSRHNLGVYRRDSK